ncbi:hypothetical protein MHL31_09055 [Lutibacter sp. A80]|uniref:hypothetical protein n=1 Tax=Lutibacter sp. A80 TaxID=2918453 RepID=UPI001F054AB6|nr:hypothetical protein [Lutibacter sp. A80]UMB59228.1 hypothetical protein MHL31_09055 [Lutibacter sp. A80]
MKKITTNVLKKIYKEEAEIYFGNLGRYFIIDENNKDYLNYLCHYFAESLDFEKKFGGELRKGLMVTGKLGTGKSSSFDIVQNISKKHKFTSLWFAKRSANEIVTKYNESPLKDSIIRDASRGKLYFDDLGAEKEASNFGKEDIFVRIFELRYEAFKEKGTKTFISTNYSIYDIKKRYGIRLYDRFKEMFNLIELNGESRRF